MDSETIQDLDYVDMALEAVDRDQTLKVEWPNSLLNHQSALRWLDRLSVATKHCERNLDIDPDLKQALIELFRIKSHSERHPRMPKRPDSMEEAKMKAIKRYLLKELALDEYNAILQAWQDEADRLEDEELAREKAEKQELARQVLYLYAVLPIETRGLIYSYLDL